MNALYNKFLYSELQESEYQEFEYKEPFTLKELTENYHIGIASILSKHRDLVQAKLPTIQGLLMHDVRKYIKK